MNHNVHATSSVLPLRSWVPTVTSVSDRVQKEDLHSYPDLEFWAYTLANGNYTDNFGRF